MIEDALMGEIGKSKEKDNLLLQALACLVLWSLTGRNKKTVNLPKKDYSLEDALTETFSRRATGSPGGNKQIIPYVS